MNVTKIKFAVLLLLPLSAFALPHVQETLSLTAGWNAVYIESTPDNPVCEDFFREYRPVRQ